MVDTREFDDNGELMRVGYRTYLALWEQRLNANQTVIEVRDNSGRIASVKHVRRYFVIRAFKYDRWFYTLVEIPGGVFEDDEQNIYH